MRKTGVASKDDLITAVLQNNLAKVVKWLGTGVSINTTDENGLPPLSHAIIQDNIPMVKFLLAQFDRNGGEALDLELGAQTPLQYAVKQGNVTMVRLLLDAGANPLGADNAGNSALHIAAQMGDLEVFNALLEKTNYLELKNTQGLSVLQVAAQHAQVDMLRCLISKGANVNSKNVEGKTAADLTTNMQVLTALIIGGAHCSKEKQAQALLWVIEQGTPEEFYSLMGCVGMAVLPDPRAAVDLAAKRKAWWIVTELILGGANFVPKVGIAAMKAEKRENHPLNVALLYQKVGSFSWISTQDFVAFLLTSEALSKDHPENRDKLIQAASKKGHKDLVCELIIAGFAFTPEMWEQALAHAIDVTTSAVLIKALLEKGTTMPPKIISHLETDYYINPAVLAALILKDIQLTPFRQEEALHGAVVAEDCMRVAALLEKGVPVDICNNSLTALHAAAAVGNLEIVELLAKKGANLNRCDGAGNTPYEIAVDKKKTAVADFLRPYHRPKPKFMLPSLMGAPIAGAVGYFLDGVWAAIVSMVISVVMTVFVQKRRLNAYRKAVNVLQGAVLETQDEEAAKLTPAPSPVLLSAAPEPDGAAEEVAPVAVPLVPSDAESLASTETNRSDNDSLSKKNN